jgi:hypothetical protein
MRHALWLAILWTPLALAGDSRRDVFFGGRDLTGWEGLTDYWSVNSGDLVGKHDGLKFNTFLCSKKTYKDFELRFQVRLTGAGANSGVQIRSKIINDKTFAVGGPQCDMGKGFWGCLYGEHYTPGKGISANIAGGMMKAADAQLVKSILKENDFNDYAIRCVGNHVTIKLNGQTTVDDDFELPAEGIIAWQLHSGGPMEAVFRKIEFRDLTK